MNKAILFDLDGTLWDATEPVVAAWNRVFAREGLALRVTEAQVRAVTGKTPAEIEAFFKQLTEQVNAKLPTTHRISKVVIRTEDFKRTGSMKVSRKDN